MIGMPQSTDEVGKNAIVTESSVGIASVVENSPAKAAGLKAGDLILQVNGVEVASVVSLQNEVAKYNGQEIKVLVKEMVPSRKSQ